MNRRTAQQNPEVAHRVIGQKLARLDVVKALRFLQKEVRRRFGKNSITPLDDFGANSLTITNSYIELTNEKSHIVARGPCRVATVLVRKRRKAK